MIIDSGGAAGAPRCFIPGRSREKCICACFGAYLCMPRALKVHVKCIQNACKCACKCPHKIFTLHHNWHTISLRIIFLHIKEYFKNYIYYFGSHMFCRKYSWIYLSCWSNTQQQTLIFTLVIVGIKPPKNLIGYKSLLHIKYIFIAILLWAVDARIEGFRDWKPLKKLM